MTHDRDELEMDDQVSTTYRAIASEVAPQHLNERVLDLAGKPTGNDSRLQAFLARWTKPSAWIVAFSLCVVVALETTRLGDPGKQTAEQSDSVSERFVPRDIQTITDAQNRAGNLDGPDIDQYPSSGTARDVTQSEFSCAASDRNSAQAWFDCIRELRESDKSIAAEREYASFILEYPEFLFE